MTPRVAAISESDPSVAGRLLLRPNFVPFAKLHEHWYLGTDHDPDNIRFIAEVDDVRTQVLFFDRNTVAWTFADEASDLRPVCRAKL